jgi:hypothetical protein
MAAGFDVAHLFWLAIVPTLVCAGAVMLLRHAFNRSAPGPAQVVSA